jgi:hypothetical protein
MTGKKVSGVRFQVSGVRERMTEVRGQTTEVRGQMSEDRRQKTEDGRQMGDEIGSGTRRRPIRRDYAAAKDAEVGKRTVDCGS